MPIHDWTRVDAGIFHDFHLEWIAAISKVLNDDLLPEGYDALAEHITRVRHVAIRDVSDDRLIAMIEIVSPGNKSGLDAFLDKIWAALDEGIHLLLVDLFPPTARDPAGIHWVIWGDSAAAPPPGQALTLAAYVAGAPRRAYVEPTAVSNALIDMPLFLNNDFCVQVPLEATYQTAWRAVPQQWKQVLTG